MNISQIEDESGIITALIEDLDGWHVPLSFEGTYEPGEECSPFPNTPSSFEIERIYIHAGGGSDTVEDPDCKPTVEKHWFKKGLLDEVEEKVADYIDNYNSEYKAECEAEASL